MAIKNISFESVEITDGFWKSRYCINADISIYAVKKRFEETNRFNALRCVSDCQTHFFYDSDAVKWIEAVAYLLVKDRNKYADLEDFCDELISSVANNQRDDGYFNSYFIKYAPEDIFKDRDKHELYCLGHMIEAAIAYDRATGKHDFLNVCKKYVDFVRKVFMIDKSAGFVTPGHEEIELALFKLYEYTNNHEYKELAEFFINERGNNDLDKSEPKFVTPQYKQDSKPVRDIDEAEGHAVRAVYLYSAMADMARLNPNDNELAKACKRIFDDIVETKMYVTGGIGSTRVGEAFTSAYDLPNLDAYAESCAAIGLVYFAQRMQMLENNAKYADVIERVLYNGFLASTSLDGKAFFYENPLEVCRSEYGKIKTTQKVDSRVKNGCMRKEVFGCSCCPPNINRFVASIGGVIYSESDDGVYVNQYISSKYNACDVTVKTNYPVDGHVRISANKYPYNKIFVRIPSWCDEYNVVFDGRTLENSSAKNGYLAIETDEKFVLDICFNIEPNFVESSPLVRENAGKVCLTCGPVVYCLEETDNGPDLFALSVDVKNCNFVSKFDERFGLMTFECLGERAFAQNESSLYMKVGGYKRECVTLKFIPYYAFMNRGESDMLVWINAKN